MYNEFDFAVSKVSELLIANHSSKQPFAVFKSASAALRKQLAEKSLAYSFENATEWLREGQENWDLTSFRRNRRTVYLIDEYVKNQTITTWVFEFENKTRFQRLPDWAKTLAEAYLGQYTHPGLQPKSIKEEKINISKFLTFIVSQIGSIEEITYVLLVKYFRQDTHKTLVTKQVYNVSIRRFLRYLENMQMVPEGMHQLLEWDNFVYIILVDELAEVQRVLFQFFSSDKNQENKKRDEKLFKCDRNP